MCQTCVSAVPRVEFFCDLCRCIEDEYHCLIECPRFNYEKEGRLPDRLYLRPSMFEFIRFLTSTVITYIKMLGSLCFKVQMEYKKYI